MVGFGFFNYNRNCSASSRRTFYKVHVFFFCSHAYASKLNNPVSFLVFFNKSSPVLHSTYFNFNAWRKCKRCCVFNAAFRFCISIFRTGRCTFCIFKSFGKFHLFLCFLMRNSYFFRSFLNLNFSFADFFLFCFKFVFKPVAVCFKFCNVLFYTYSFVAGNFAFTNLADQVFKLPAGLAHKLIKFSGFVVFKFMFLTPKLNFFFCKAKPFFFLFLGFFFSSVSKLIKFGMLF